MQFCTASGLAVGKLSKAPTVEEPLFRGGGVDLGGELVDIRTPPALTSRVCSGTSQPHAIGCIAGMLSQGPKPAQSVAWSTCLPKLQARSAHNSRLQTWAAARASGSCLRLSPRARLAQHAHRFQPPSRLPFRSSWVARMPESSTHTLTCRQSA